MSLRDRNSLTTKMNSYNQLIHIAAYIHIYILLLYKLFFTEAVDHKPKMQHGDYCFFFNRFYAMHVLIFYSTPPPPGDEDSESDGPFRQVLFTV